MMNTCLVCVLENNHTNINHKSHPGRLLENEALKCIRSWRKNGGRLSNIDIYVICITKNTPSTWCINQLKCLGVEYIEKYLPRTSEFKNGWWNKPLACSYLEGVLSHDWIIHIDLDMYLQREIPFNISRNMCLVYDDFDSRNEREFNIENDVNPYNTCFMVMHRRDKIYTMWYDKLMSGNLKADILKYFKSVEYGKYEEGALDIVNIENNKLVHPVTNIMFGETYTPLNEMTSIHNVCFHHYHMYSKPDLSRYDHIRSRRMYNDLVS